VSTEKPTGEPTNISRRKKKRNISYTGRGPLSWSSSPLWRFESTGVMNPIKFNQSINLGVTIDSRLKFSTHINGIAAKAHRRANLLIRCFMSRDLTSLIRAFTTYVDQF